MLTQMWFCGIMKKTKRRLFMKRSFIMILTLCCLLSFLVSCDFGNAFTDGGVDENDHDEHTFEYIAYESGHFKQFTCGCPSPEIMGMHYDDDGNGFCDLCDYKLEE